MGVFDDRDYSEPDPRLPGPAARGLRGQIWPLLGFIGLCLLVAAADGAVTAPSLGRWYLSLARPPGTPPDWLFAPVWTVLHVMIGTAAWLVWRRTRPSERGVLRLWGWQLLVNAAWSPVFFALHGLAPGLAVLLLLLGLVGLTTGRFWRISPLAGGMMLPYALWTCYAAYLNAGFLWLNPG